MLCITGECRLYKRYVEHFSEVAYTGQGLLFWGNVGTSKTFLAGCIANALLEKNTSAYKDLWTRKECELIDKAYYICQTYNRFGKIPVQATKLKRGIIQSCVFGYTGTCGYGIKGQRGVLWQIERRMEK